MDQNPTGPPDLARLVGGRYILETLIGEGATGEVWRARHATLDSPVAIKLLHGSAAFRETTRRRFLTEARVAAQLNTRHAVKVFDFGFTDQGRPYLVMEFLDGETLEARLSRLGTLPPCSTALILRLAARALDSAHALGIVHRDFKPENILLMNDSDGLDDVKVVDFGIAKLLRGFDEGELEGADSPEREHALAFTHRGRFVGTPFYMAPEQTRAETDVHATLDVWAMGVVAYECLTGRRPFLGRDMQTLFDRIQTSEHPLAHEVNPALPTTFEDWFRTACHPEPRNRFQSASAAAATLLEALDIQTSSFPPPDVGAASSLAPSARSSHPAPDSSRSQRVTLSVPSDPGRARQHTRKRLLLGATVAFAAVLVTAYWLRYGAQPSLATEPITPVLVDSVSHSASNVQPAPESVVSATPRESDIDSVLPGTIACPEQLPMGYRSLPSTWVSATPPYPSMAPPPPSTTPSTVRRTAPTSPFELPPLGL